MKKLLMSLFSIGIVANAGSTTLSVMSDNIKTKENNNLQNNNFTINDLMNLEENQNAKNSKGTSSSITDSNLANVVSNFSSNKITSLNNLLKQLGSKKNSQTKLNGLLSVVNISKLFSGVLGKLLTQVSGGFDVKTTSDVVENIFKNLSVDQILTEMDKFGTYDESGKADISKSPFVGKSYSTLLSTYSKPFTTAILKTVDAPTKITNDDENSIIDGMLLIINYLSQYNYTFGTSALDSNGITDIFKSSDGKGDPLYKQSIYAQTFTSTSYTNLSQLITNINDYHNNYGSGLRQLLFVFFGFTPDISSELTAGVLSHGAGYDWRLHITNTMTGSTWIGSEHFQENPGAAFAKNDPFIQFVNGMFEAIFANLKKDGKMPNSYTYEVKIDQKKSIYNITGDGVFNEVTDLFGPILYLAIDNIVEDSALNGLMNSLDVLGASIKQMTNNSSKELAGTPDVWSSLQTLITNDYVNKTEADNFHNSLANTSVFPFVAPAGGWSVFGTKMENPNFDADKAYYEHDASIKNNTWIAAWNGNLLPTALNLTTEVAGDFAPTIKIPTIKVTNLQDLIQNVMDTKIATTTLSKILTGAAKVANQLPQLEGILSSTITALNTKESDAKSLYENSVDVNKDATYFNRVTKSDNCDTLLYLGAIAYAINNQYLKSTVDVTTVETTVLTIMGYDVKTSSITKDSAFDILNRNIAFLETMNQTLPNPLLVDIIDTLKQLKS